MPNVEWSVAHEIESSFMNLNFNADLGSGGRYQILPDSYDILPSVRATQDDISQRSGSVMHPHYLTGMQATVKIAYWMLSRDPTTGDEMPGSEYVPACGSTVVLLHEQLMGVFQSILTAQSAGGPPQRLLWTPTGEGDRKMLDQIQVLSWPTVDYDVDGELAQVQFTVVSPFPYALGETQTTTSVPAGTPTTITQGGNSPYDPVVQVTGPFSTFTLQNDNDLDTEGNPKKLVYNSALPGAVSVAGGHYAEIDMFRGSIILDGNSTDLIAGLDPTVSDTWALQPGANVIHSTGPSSSVLWNTAWV